MIFPRVVKAALLFGGGGGNGVQADAASVMDDRLRAMGGPYRTAAPEPDDDETPEAADERDELDPVVFDCAGSDVPNDRDRVRRKWLLGASLIGVQAALALAL